MVNRTRLIALILIFTASTLQTALPARASTFTVTRTDDPPPDGCKPDDCSLREAVIAANVAAGADTITIPADTFTLSINDGDPAADTGELKITHDVTIIGAGTEGTKTTKIVNALDDPSFAIWPDTEVVMSNLVITGGDTGSGGGIQNHGNLTLTDVVILGNHGSISGGGIANYGALTLMRVDISENTAYTGGGIINLGFLAITDSLFSDNRNESFSSPNDDRGTGGAIHNLGTLTVTKTIFDSNRAGSGGAIYNEFKVGVFAVPVATLTEVRLTGNSATGLGGGLSSYGGGAVANNGGVLSLARSTIDGNSSGGAGGGILNDNGTVTITASSIYSNAAAGSGGGIYNLNQEFAQGVITLSNSTLSGNSAVQSGGGIFNDRFGATTSLSHVTVANNIADADNDGAGTGGGICKAPGIRFPDPIPSGTVNLTGALLAGNVDLGGEAPDCGGAPLDGHGYNLVQNVTGCNLGDDSTGNVTGVDPLLGPLADNGGPTLTHLPADGSPAIDAGNPADCPATDQRGVARPADGDGDGAAVCDIGSAEIGATAERVIYLPLTIK
jgi:CSLREA domain-containing protein